MGKKSESVNRDEHIMATEACSTEGEAYKGTACRLTTEVL